MQSVRDQLHHLVQLKRLPHALLFCGDDDHKKKQTALQFSADLLCKTFHETGKACLTCHACRLVQSGTHPDLLLIEAAENHAIKIDQIREVIEFVNQTALLGGYRIIIIHPATMMNMNSANALLKILEEPSARVLFILTADLNMRLMDTILSRCQKIIFPSTHTVMDEEQQIMWEEFNQLTQRKLDPLALAGRWQEKNIEFIFKLIFYQVKERVWKNASQPRDDSARFFEYNDHVQRIKSFIQAGHHLNQRLLLEDLFIRWARVV